MLIGKEFTFIIYLITVFSINLRFCYVQGDTNRSFSLVMYHIVVKKEILKNSNNIMVLGSFTQLDRFLMNYGSAAAENN